MQLLQLHRTFYFHAFIANGFLVIACLLFGEQAVAQVTTDSVQTTEKTPKELKYREPFKWKVKGLRVGIDAVPLAFTALEPDYTGATAHIGFNINNRYWLSTDIGTESSERTKNASPFYNNQTQGFFWRLGVDYNISYWTIPEGAAMCFGLHYGRSSFSNTLINPSINPAWGNVLETIESPKLNSSWLEPRFTMQANIFKHLSAAVMLGLRVRMSLTDYQAFPNEIPGFGLTKHQGMLAFGYRICYEFGATKAKPESTKKVMEAESLP